MADQKNDRIDPRFDPAFQRGFEGEPAPLSSSQRQQVGTVPANEGYAASPLVRDQPLASSPQHPSPQLSTSQHSVPPAQRHSSEQFESEAELDEAPTGGLNPFLIGLLVIAAALIGAGIYLLQWSRELMNGSQVDFVLAQTVIYAVPIAIGLGVATAIGVAFVYAVRWRRSNTGQS